MKLLLKQYLASLNERDELDVVLPDILSEAGFNVISRPMRGTKQYGVDVVAIGPHPRTGVKTLYLLSIKSGNLTRASWEDGKQALRQSLEQILDFYIPSLIPARHKHLPILVTMCFGGDVQEDVKAQVNGFTSRNTVEGKIEFEEWNGDQIAEFMLSGLLREKLFPASMQSSFRKALAFVDEPEVCTAHFTSLLSQLFATPPKNHAARLRIARQVYLATWNVFVWGRDAKNLDAAYRASAIAVLWTWDLCREHLETGAGRAALLEIAQKMIWLARMIGSAYVSEHVVAYSKVENGLGSAVRPWASVDVNLKLFEVLGRTAIHGLWLLHGRELLKDTADTKEIRDSLDLEIQETLQVVCAMIVNNQIFNSPLRDDHAIEIMLASFLLTHCGGADYVSGWLTEIADSTIFSYRTNGHYPCVLHEYADLAAHPMTQEGYREEVTTGSILYPTLAVWLALLGNEPMVERLGAFHDDHMSHSTWQLWVPDEVSEQLLYRNSGAHGSSIADIGVWGNSEKLIKELNKEIVATQDFGKLSAMRHGLWPIVLIACQTYRLPVPIHFWAMKLGGRGA